MAADLLLAVDGGGTRTRAAVADLERRSIEAALSSAGGNKSKAASELGISRFALQRKLEKYGLASKGEEAPQPDASESN